MKTFRDALMGSFGEVEEMTLIPMSFPYFIMNIGALNAIQIAMKNPNVTGIELASRMNPLNFNLDSTMLAVNTWGFLTWLLNQPLYEDETDEHMWYDIEIIQMYLNKYIEEKR